MNAIIRAKIRINSVVSSGLINNETEVETKHNEQIYAAAVYSDDRTTENWSFSKATPSLQLTMVINNPDAFDKLEQGKEYYLDFIPVPEEK